MNESAALNEPVPEPAAIGISRGERRRRVAWPFAIASFAVCVGSCMGAVALDSTWLAIAGVPALLALFASSALLGRGSRARLFPGDFLIDGSSLDLRFRGKRRVIPRADMQTAWIEEPKELHVQTVRGEEIVVAAESPERATSLLRELELGAEKRVLRVPLVSATARFRGGRALSVLGIVSLMPAILFAVLCASMGIGDHGFLRSSGGSLAMSFFVGIAAGLSALVFALLAELRSRDVIVGTDGLYMTSSQAFLPFTKIAGVSLHRDGVMVHRDGGKIVLLATRTSDELSLATAGAPARNATSPGARAQQLLYDRIRTALARPKDGQSRKLELLDSAGRSAKQWRDALHALSGGGGNFRVAGITDEELEEAIADVQVEPLRRVAAVVALSGRSPERARECGRVAAYACADAKLREALERASAGELSEEYVELARRGAR